MNWEGTTAASANLVVESCTYALIGMMGKHFASCFEGWTGHRVFGTTDCL